MEIFRFCVTYILKRNKIDKLICNFSFEPILQKDILGNFFFTFLHFFVKSNDKIMFVTYLINSGIKTRRDIKPVNFNKHNLRKKKLNNPRFFAKKILTNVDKYMKFYQNK